MDFVQDRPLDRADYRIFAMGMVFLYFDLDDLHLYRRLLQGTGFLLKPSGESHLQR